MYELSAVFFECRHSIEGEFIVRSYGCTRARDYHGRDAFVGFQKIFGEGAGDGNEVSF